MPDETTRATRRTAEQEARDMLARMGIEDAQAFTAGEVVEIANLVTAARGLQKRLAQWELSRKVPTTSETDAIIDAARRLAALLPPEG